MVISYDLPINKELYLHRIGRTGRFNRKGVAINFCTTDDFRNLRALEHHYQIDIDEMPENIGELI